jgi:hypothetical protein
MSKEQKLDNEPLEPPGRDSEAGNQQEKDLKIYLIISGMQSMKL